MLHSLKKSILHLDIKIVRVIINIIQPLPGPKHAEEKEHHSLDFQLSYFIIPIKGLLLGYLISQSL